MEPIIENVAKMPKKTQVNKKCDICNKIKPKGFCLSEEIFGNNMASIVSGISGTQVNENILAKHFSCRECTISLIAAEDIVTKARNLVTKLTKPRGSRKPKSNKSIEEQSVLAMTTPFKAQQTSTVRKRKPAAKKVTSSELKPSDTSEIGAYDSFMSKELESDAITSSTLVPNAATPNKVKTPKATVTKMQNGDSEGKTKATKKKDAINSKSPAKKQKLPEKSQEDSTVTFIKFKDDDEEESNGNELKPKKRPPKKDKPKPKPKANANANGNGNASENEIEVIAMESEDQIDSNDSKFEKECRNCGKIFHIKEKYEGHIFSQKCRNAIYECQYLNCKRRFTKKSKMQEHMVKKHGEE